MIKFWLRNFLSGSSYSFFSSSKSSILDKQITLDKNSGINFNPVTKILILFKYGTIGLCFLN